MSKIEQVITKTPKDHDSDDVRWEVDGEEKGFGFCAKGGTTVSLVRCPLCGRENYAMNVTSGYCTWCPFNANSL